LFSTTQLPPETHVTIDRRTPSVLGYLAALRIAMGLLFVSVWVENVRKGFYTAAGLQAFFTHVYPQAANPLHGYAQFIDHVILPNRALFGHVQFASELAIGVFLLLGLFTPLVGVGAAVLLLNIFLATYGHEWPWTYITPIVVLLCVSASRAGRFAGFDAVFARAEPRPKVPLW